MRLYLWHLRTLAQFQGNEMSPGLFKDFMDGYIKDSQDHPRLNPMGSQFSICIL